jgi:hypothetical protein
MTSSGSSNDNDILNKINTNQGTAACKVNNTSISTSADGTTASYPALVQVLQKVL